MALRLHDSAYDFARTLINAGCSIYDERDAWSEHQPSARQENGFIEEHGLREYGRWHLGVDDDVNPETKGHYKFPYGDFHDVHRCAMLAAESRAGQRKYFDIQRAAAHLHGMIEAAHNTAQAPPLAPSTSGAAISGGSHHDSSTSLPSSAPSITSDPDDA
jgi:hypothetical protein